MSEMSVSRKYRKRSHAAEIWRNFRKNKGAMLGLFILLIIFAIALTIEFWIDKDLVIGQHVAQRLKPPSWQHLFGTDDKGREMTSPDMAQWLQKRMSQSTKRLVFIIGGPYGFSPDVYNRVPGRLSLSRMTFSHQMVRLIFVEQLYRAFAILNNLPYHHE